MLLSYWNIYFLFFGHVGHWPFTLICFKSPTHEKKKKNKWKPIENLCR